MQLEFAVTVKGAAGQLPPTRLKGAAGGVTLLTWISNTLVFSTSTERVALEPTSTPPKSSGFGVTVRPAWVTRRLRISWMLFSPPMEPAKPSLKVGGIGACVLKFALVMSRALTMVWKPEPLSISSVRVTAGAGVMVRRTGRAPARLPVGTENGV